MTLGLGERILEREISSYVSARRAYRDFYGDAKLVRELDIVNELDGHSGCVNALSWSKSGRLLASGSDDQHLNIHAYQPDNSDKQFQLQTTVATGHTQNIFSVKFMPQSNDRTVITCAGDGDVRVFDLEYSGRRTDASAASARAAAGRRARRSNVYNGVKYLSDGDTNSRVYRSHGDRVKRIVTESSPYLFLTCSEDGEVRQWDTRQPSEAYLRPATGRYGGGNDNVPPALISYQPYGLDLNTISCSPSQPHYIALGGANIHCFLHDRRMTGRDRLQESGRSLRDGDAMDQATRCVRKFAPKGRESGARGHITACKISDARPDEMIASWSGDHIYSFDLIRSPDADDTVAQVKGISSKNKPRKAGVLKRKRKMHSSSTSLDQGSVSSIREGVVDSATTLRIRYQNGQQEDVTITYEQEASSLTAEESEAQRITRAVLRIYKNFFSRAGERDNYVAFFSQTLGQCAVLLSDIDEVLRGWTYSIDPSPEHVTLQRKLRTTREAVRRCVQAVGTISRILGGKLRTTSGISPLMDGFMAIETRSSELKLTARDSFSFDVIKSIVSWLDSGRGRLIEAFTRPAGLPASSRAAYRLPIPENDATSEAIEDRLIPYLRSLISSSDTSVSPIVDVESNRFETDASRCIFGNEITLIDAFRDAVARPFRDLSSPDEFTSQSLDRQDAIQFWALRVARGVLLDAFNSIDMRLVEVAFGGRRTVSDVELTDSAELATVNEEDEDVNNLKVLQADGTDRSIGNGSAPPNDLRASAATSEDEDDEEMEDYVSDDDLDYALLEDEDEQDSSEPDEEDGVPNLGPPRYMYQASTAHERRQTRDQAGSGVPCSTAIRTYKGHCNVKTVKDVNYFGLEDEYVVSGSDDGNLFIWDRKTSKLVNVLEGDGEVVNVVQGHPYETMLAVSGIDHTIKIFSPDSHAREIARLGQGVSAHDPATFSSLAWPNRLGYAHARRRSSHTTRNERRTSLEVDEYVAEGGLGSRRRINEVQSIVEQNDQWRRRGDDDAVITRSMLQHLAQRMREHRQAHGADADTTLEGFETTEDEDGRVELTWYQSNPCYLCDRLY